VLDGKVKRAFCIPRPPGHHATRERGMGFCIFNNVAVAACYARQVRKVSRILIVDWDVHHGNGTQDIFYDDPSVFYFSTHQWGWFPGTGAAHEQGTGEGHGSTLNCPFAAGACGWDLVQAFKTRLIPAMRQFRPELVMISAGFDAETQDPLGGFALDPDDFEELTALTCQIAELYAGGRLVSVLEGGYRLSRLAECVAAHVKQLTEF